MDFYDEEGKIETHYFGNYGTVDYTYDDDGRVTSETFDGMFGRNNSFKNYYDFSNYSGKHSTVKQKRTTRMSSFFIKTHKIMQPFLPSSYGRESYQRGSKGRTEEPSRSL